MGSAIEQGRASYDGRRWAEAYELLSQADRESPLSPDDLERLGTAAYLIGRDSESDECLVRLHNEALGRGDEVLAARAAFWLAFSLWNRREHARGAGWLSRGRRLLDEGHHDCVEQGYFLLLPAIETMFGGDPASAYNTMSRVAEIADRFGDVNLNALVRLCQGQALIMQGQTTAGTSLFDEVMVAITTGEVSPVVSGLTYCAVIETCSEIFDLRRAQEWTAALSRWCEAQPDMIPYRGQCLVRRAEIMQLHGEWPNAMREVERARDTLAQRGERAVGAALYQKAELHRLRGEFAKAEEEYRSASQWGRKPHPGLARLRLAQGQIEAAKGAICRVLDESRDPPTRARMLGAYVEIMLAASDIDAARKAAEELCEIADSLHSPFLRAVSSQAKGAVLLAQKEAREALSALRSAAAAWGDLEAPYEVARTGALIGLACRALGDEDTADIELDTAGRVLEALGATPDVTRVQELRTSHEAAGVAGLTGRETEVLRLVAAGKTNRAIADELAISEKTIARHVSNIFMKLGVSTRAAATAYAFKRGLV
jgi:DNA-binding NarL/FixJ family response regulator